MESDADFLSRYWEELNWDPDDTDMARLFALARKGAEADVENARLREVLEPEFLGRIVYETWLKAADGPAWISYNDLAHLAPDDRAAIEQIVEAVRTALTPPKQENENE